MKRAIYFLNVSLIFMFGYIGVFHLLSGEYLISPYMVGIFSLLLSANYLLDVLGARVSVKGRAE